MPSQWHPITQKDLDAAIKAAGGSSSGIWSTAFDADTAPSADTTSSTDISKPSCSPEVLPLSATGSNELSYNALRDFCCR